MSSESNDPYDGVKPIVRLLNLIICMGISTWLTFWVYLPARHELDESAKAAGYEPSGFFSHMIAPVLFYISGYAAFELANKLTTGKD